MSRFKQQRKSKARGQSVAIEVFEFHGDELAVVPLPDGDVGVVLRRLCECIPVDADGQIQRLGRLEAAGVKWATTCVIQVVADDGKVRDMRVLPRRSIPMWAATMDVSRLPPNVRDDVRAKLVTYQDDCAEALADRFIGRKMPDERVAPEILEVLRILQVLSERVAHLESRRGPANTNGPTLGPGAAKVHILDPLKDIARTKARAIKNESTEALRSLRFSAERDLRRALKFEMGANQRWQNFPESLLGEALCVLARMKGEADRLAGVAGTTAKQMHLRAVK